MGCIQARLRYNTSNALTMKSFSRVNKKVFRSSHSSATRNASYTHKAYAYNA